MRGRYSCFLPCCSFNRMRDGAIGSIGRAMSRMRRTEDGSSRVQAKLFLERKTGRQEVEHARSCISPATPVTIADDAGSRIHRDARGSVAFSKRLLVVKARLALRTATRSSLLRQRALVRLNKSAAMNIMTRHPPIAQPWQTGCPAYFRCVLVLLSHSRGFPRNHCARCVTSAALHGPLTFRLSLSYRVALQSSRQGHGTDWLQTSR
jgi:hypothetical protein